MAMKTNVKKKKPEDERPKDVHEKMVKAIDEAGNDDTPSLKQDDKGNVQIIGDPTKTKPQKNTDVYKIRAVYPKDEYDIDDFNEDAIVSENAVSFTIEIEAAQEEITPFNRGFLSAASTDFVLTFFTRGEDGVLDLRPEPSLTTSSVRFYRNDIAIEQTKFFVGKLLGLDEDTTLHLHETDMIEVAMILISKNPSVINTAYYDAK